MQTHGLNSRKGSNCLASGLDSESLITQNLAIHFLWPSAPLFSSLCSLVSFFQKYCPHKAGAIALADTGLQTQKRTTGEEGKRLPAKSIKTNSEEL